jgi:uncharacterized caspase-like protein
VEKAPVNVTRLLLGVVFLLGSIALARADSEQRVALVIGNGNYQAVQRLKNPSNDAKAVAATLRNLGFEVLEREDINRRSMIDAVRRFAKKLSPGGIGLFYYAGHGIQAKGVNYLVPVDASLAVEDDLRYEALDLQDVLTALDDGRVRLSLVILDACRDNPFAKTFRSTSRGLAQIDPPRGTFIAYATGPGKVAADGNGDHSVYTEALLELMTQPLRLQDIFDKVTDAVEQKTKQAQTPWTNSSFRGDFYFIGPTAVTINPSPTPTLVQPGVSPEAQEMAAWAAVLNSKTAAPFKAFLEGFPKGIYAGIAKAKVEE